MKISANVLYDIYNALPDIIITIIIIVIIIIIMIIAVVVVIVSRSESNPPNLDYYDCIQK